MAQDPTAGRLFIAATLPHMFRTDLAGHLRQHLGPQGLPGRAVPKDNWHLTLRFLGDTDADAYRRLENVLAAAEFGPVFDLVFDSLGAFPRPDRARVLWIGASAGQDRLTALASKAEQAAVAAGFVAEKRPFRTHLTLARLKPDRDVRPVISAVPPLGRGTTIDEVVLYRSHLSRDGAQYEALHRYRLAPAT